MKNSCAHAIAKTTQVVAQNYTLVIVCGSIGAPPSFEPYRYYPLVNIQKSYGCHHLEVRHINYYGPFTAISDQRLEKIHSNFRYYTHCW
jgi:hypothetical protein